MADKTEVKRWNVQRRLEFIDFRLYWEGRLNRLDLTEYFGISTPQATTDIAHYQEIAGRNLEYSHKEKAYTATPEFVSALSQANGQQYLSQLRLISSQIVNREETWIGWEPNFETIPSISRKVDAAKLRKILQTIKNKQSLFVKYQSLSRENPLWRWITPHALAFNGVRWHVRAWCHLRNNFQDFLFARIVDQAENRESEIDNAMDIEWHKKTIFKIGPHPKLSAAAKKAIELDYDMVDGVLEIETRLALSFYLERQLNLDIDPNIVSAQRQQIVWLNREQIRAECASAKQEAKTLAENVIMKNKPVD